MPGYLSCRLERPVASPGKKLAPRGVPRQAKRRWLYSPCLIDCGFTRPNARRKVLIIGAGMFGLSSAWHLLDDGRHEVVILDHPDNVAPCFQDLTD